MANNTKNIAKNPVSNRIALTNAQINFLVAQAQGANKYMANKAIVTLVKYSHNLMVGAVIKSHCKASMFEDCMSDAKIGLLNAIQDYNPVLGTPFNFYAYMRVLYAVYEGFECEVAESMPHNVYRNVLKLKAAKSKYEQEHGMQPSNSELAKITGLKKSALKNAINAEYGFNKISVNDPNCQAVDTYYGTVEFQEDMAVEAPMVEVNSFDIQSQMALLVRICNAVCGKKNASFLKAYTSMLGKGMSNEAIAAALGMSREALAKRLSRIKCTISSNKQAVALFHSTAA